MGTELKTNGGIPGNLLIMMAIVGGLAVANNYYCQPLLEEIRKSFGCTAGQANLMTVITQTGYATGLLFIVPLADMWPRRVIITVSMGLAAISSCIIALSCNILTAWCASLVLGACSVIPQIFIPMASQFSRPEHKSRNMGYVLSGLLTGILAARVISGWIGDLLGWRSMFVISSVIMLICMCITLIMLPRIQPDYRGTWTGLMKSVFDIFGKHRKIRLYSLRGALSFASMMSIWACMAFHIAGKPFYAGSDMVGLLGLSGMAGAIAASGIGKFVQRFGITRFSVIGALVQLGGWTVSLAFQYTYIGLVVAIILADLGAQCQQLSNQTASFADAPEATSRVNTIFMTMLFIGGSVGTFCSGIAWNAMGWTGVCFTGIIFAILSLGLSAYIQKSVIQ